MDREAPLGQTLGRPMERARVAAEGAVRQPLLRTLGLRRSTTAAFDHHLGRCCAAEACSGCCGLYPSPGSAHRPLQYKPDDASLDCGGWLLTLFGIRGRALRHVALPLCVLAAESLLVAALAEAEVGLGLLQLPQSRALDEGYRMLMVPVSFLLVFRLNRAAVRFYDARAALGKLVEVCRTLAGQAVRFCSHDPVARDDVCRWVVALPVATRNYLRVVTPDPVEELKGVLTSEEADALRRAATQPLLCLDRIRRAALAGARSNKADSGVVAGVGLHAMEESVCILTGAWGAVERINSTPLPFAYVAHLRTFLMLYLLGMPFALHGAFGWGMPAVTLLAAFGMLGIEGAAVVCERPFGFNENHLPLDHFCNVVANNVAQLLQQADESDGLADSAV